MAPRQATSKGTAKKVAKVFASKTVKDVLEKLITRSVEGENSNKKTVTVFKIAGKMISSVFVITTLTNFSRFHFLQLEKWASKMKLSVLKKISEASKIAFLSKGAFTLLG